jgi:hypothetical protein
MRLLDTKKGSEMHRKHKVTERVNLRSENGKRRIDNEMSTDLNLKLFEKLIPNHNETQRGIGKFKERTQISGNVRFLFVDGRV